MRCLLHGESHTHFLSNTLLILYFLQPYYNEPSIQQKVLGLLVGVCGVNVNVF